MLNEHLISYTKEELNNQLLIILMPYYKKKLQQLNFNEYDKLSRKSKLNKTIKI